MKFHKTCVSLFSVATALGVVFFPVIALAQVHRIDPDADAAAGCAACGGCGLIFAILAVAILALHIVILVWVARDAKARGVDSPVLWIILVVLTGVIGLLVYIFARPQGSLVSCSHCQNKRLQASAKCPHCGNP